VVGGPGGVRVWGLGLGGGIPGFKGRPPRPGNWKPWVGLGAFLARNWGFKPLGGIYIRGLGLIWPLG